MKIKIDREADAAYITLKQGEVFETVAESNDVMIDFDNSGNILGIEILNYSNKEKDNFVFPHAALAVGKEL